MFVSIILAESCQSSTINVNSGILYAYFLKPHIKSEPTTTSNVLGTPALSPLYSCTTSVSLHWTLQTKFPYFCLMSSVCSHLLFFSSVTWSPHRPVNLFISSFPALIYTPGPHFLICCPHVYTCSQARLTKLSRYVADFPHSCQAITYQAIISQSCMSVPVPIDGTN